MGKPQNRLELRRQYDAAEPLDPMEDESEDLIEEVDDDSERRPKKKAKPKTPRAKAVKAPKPAARMRIVWVVVNDAFKVVATFEFTQKELAETKAAEMTARGKGTHFVQKSKEAMPDNAPGIGAVLPRPQIEPAVAKVVDVPVEDEEPEDEDFDEDEDEDEADEED